MRIKTQSLNTAHLTILHFLSALPWKWNILSYSNLNYPSFPSNLAPIFSCTSTLKTLIRDSEIVLFPLCTTAKVILKNSAENISHSTLLLLLRLQFRMRLGLGNLELKLMEERSWAFTLYLRTRYHADLPINKVLTINQTTTQGSESPNWRCPSRG